MNPGTSPVFSGTITQGKTRYSSKNNCYHAAKDALFENLNNFFWFQTFSGISQAFNWICFMISMPKHFSSKACLDQSIVFHAVLYDDHKKATYVLRINLESSRITLLIDGDQIIRNPQIAAISKDENNIKSSKALLMKSKTQMLSLINA